MYNPGMLKSLVNLHLLTILDTHIDIHCWCPVVCSMASTIIQMYLKQVLESFFHSQSYVRLHALSVITLILKQGLVHPVQVLGHSSTNVENCKKKCTIMQNCWNMYKAV